MQSLIPLSASTPLPQWLLNADKAMKDLKDRTNEIQQGLKDKANMIGDHTVHTAKVCELVKSIREDEAILESLKEKINTHHNAIEQCIKELDSVQKTDPTYLETRVEQLGSGVKDLTKFFMHAFGNMEIIRGMSDEHKSELHSLEASLLQEEKNNLQAEMKTLQEEKDQLLKQGRSAMLDESLRTELNKTRNLYQESLESMDGLRKKADEAEEELATKTSEFQTRLQELEKDISTEKTRSSLCLKQIETERNISMERREVILKDLKEEQAARLEEMQVKDSEIQSYRDLCAEASSKIKELEAEVNDHTVLQSQLGHQINDAHIEKLRADNAIKELENVKTQKDKEITKLTEERDESLSKLQQSEAQCLDLQRKNTAWNNDWSTLYAKFKKLGDDNADLSIRLRQAEKDYEKASNNLDSAQDAYDKLRTQHHLTLNELKTEKAITVNLKKSVKDLKEAKEGQVKEIKQLKKEVEDYAARLASVEGERDCAISKHEAAGQQKGKCEDELKRRDEEIRGLKSQAEALQAGHKQELDDMTAKKDSLEEEKQSLKRQAEVSQASHKQELDNMTTKQGNLDEEIRSLKSQAETLQASHKQELDDITAKNSNLEEEIRGLKEQAEALQASHKQQLDDITAKKDNLEEERRSLKRQSEASQASHKQELNDMTAKKGNLEEQVKGLEEQVKSLEEQVKCFEEQVKSLEEQVKSLEKTVSSQDHANRLMLTQHKEQLKQLVKKEDLDHVQSHANKLEGTVKELQATSDKAKAEARISAANAEALQEDLQYLTDNLNTKVHDFQTSIQKELDELVKCADKNDDAVARYFASGSGISRRFSEPWHKFLTAVKSHTPREVDGDLRTELPWLVMQPLPNPEEDAKLCSLTSAEPAYLIMQLYGQVSIRSLSNKSFCLLVSLTDSLAGATWLQDTLIELLITSAVELITSSTLESDLLLLGFYNLYTLIQDRWNLNNIDNDIITRLRQKLSRSPIISELFTAMENDDLQEFCRRRGLFYEQQAAGLVKLPAIKGTIIYINFKTKTMQALNSSRIDMAGYDGRLIKVTSSKEDIILPIKSQETLRWWLTVD